MVDLMPTDFLPSLVVMATLGGLLAANWKTKAGWFAASLISLASFATPNPLQQVLAIELVAMGVLLITNHDSRRRAEALFKLLVTQGLASVLLLFGLLDEVTNTPFITRLIFIVGFALKFGMWPLHRGWLDYSDGAGTVPGVWFSLSYRLVWLLLLSSQSQSLTAPTTLGLVSAVALALLLLPQGTLNRTQAYFNLFVTSLLSVIIGTTTRELAFTLAPVMLGLASLPKVLAPEADMAIPLAPSHAKLSPAKITLIWCQLLIPVALTCLATQGQASIRMGELEVPMLSLGIIVVSMPLIYRTAKLTTLLSKTCFGEGSPRP